MSAVPNVASMSNATAEGRAGRGRVLAARRSDAARSANLLRHNVLLRAPKEQRAEKAEQQETERQLREATRLVSDELSNISLTIGTARDSEIWWSNPPHDLESSAWRNHKTTLASLIDDDTWSNVRDAYSALADFNVRLGMGREGKEVTSPLVDEVLPAIHDQLVADAWLAEMGDLLDYVDEARKVLGAKFWQQTSG
jgi:hypothetical protein